MLIGGEDGRTCFFDIQNHRSCFSLDARSDFISSAAFSHSNKLVCIGAYDKALKVHNIHKHTVIADVDLSDTPEDVLFSDDDDYILGITRDRKVFSYSLLDNSLIYANIILGEWPTSIVKIGRNHILVGTKGDILYIFHLNDLSLTRRFKVDNYGVKTLKIHEEILYIHTSLHNYHLNLNPNNFN
ncbi:MAG: hypothetical protein Q9M43_11170 [Sulfurimonas sp.]|nr:hypothetical protein [Sulfurimonas sp.]